MILFVTVWFGYMYYILAKAMTTYNNNSIISVYYLRFTLEGYFSCMTACITLAVVLLEGSYFRMIFSAVQFPSPLQLSIVYIVHCKYTIKTRFFALKPNGLLSPEQSLS